MVRTQIQLTEELYRKLKRWSRDLGISVSEAIRRCVSDRLDREMESPTREQLIRDAMEVCGKYEDPQGDSRVARDHDRYLDGIYGH